MKEEILIYLAFFLDLFLPEYSRRNIVIVGGVDNLLRSDLHFVREIFISINRIVIEYVFQYFDKHAADLTRRVDCILT